MPRVKEQTPKRRARRQFTDELRAGALRLALDEGKTVSQVARDRDLTASALSTWVKHARGDRSKGRTGLTTADRESLRSSRRRFASCGWSVTS